VNTETSNRRQDRAAQRYWRTQDPRDMAKLRWLWAQQSERQALREAVVEEICVKVRNRTCQDCGRTLIPATSWFDGEETTCGYRRCICSREAWLDSDEKEYGASYSEYLDEINARERVENHRRNSSGCAPDVLAR
jgi:hypothetical protein